MIGEAVTRRPELGRARAAAAARVDEVLESVPETDRVWHQLSRTSPIVIELLARVRADHAPPARVLLIGSNIVLAQALVQCGYTIDLWHFAEGHLSDDLLPLVREIVTPAQLSVETSGPDGAPYDAILLPFVLESLTGDPQILLKRLRSALSATGSLFVVTTNASRLDIRLLTLLGRSTAEAYPQNYLSFSWPPLPRRRYYHHADLLPKCRAAGLRVREIAFVKAQHAYAQVDPLTVGQLALRQLASVAQRALPGTRDALLLHLAPRVDGDQGPRERDPRLDADPSVSAILSATHGVEPLRQALQSLLDQDYPPDRFEILVVHDGQSDATRGLLDELIPDAHVPIREIVQRHAEGPVARNAAMVAARGDVCAHIDDECHPPQMWVRTLATTLDQTTGVVTGPILEDESSYPCFLVLPGSRVMWIHKGLFPIYNVAYWREPALAAGGFAAAEFTSDRDPLPLGWDSELAWRLQRLGWEGKYLKDLFLFRRYAAPQRRTWIRENWRLAQDLPHAVAVAPELQPALLTAGYFAGSNTLWFDLLAVGLAASLVRRNPRWSLLALPWLFWNRTYADAWPPGRWLWTARVATALTARHVIWMGGLAVGSVRARRLVL